MYGYIFLKNKLEQSVGYYVKHDSYFGAYCGYLFGEQTNDNDRYNRDVVETCKYSNNLK